MSPHVANPGTGCLLCTCIVQVAYQPTANANEHKHVFRLAQVGQPYIEAGPELQQHGLMITTACICKLDYLDTSVTCR